jgi:uncharacterized protein with FMN-binding domain
MRGSRFIVLKLSHITRTAVIALIGLIAIIALIIAVLPKRSPGSGASIYNPGTYTAHIILNNRPVSVSVTVDAHEITSIEMSDMEASLEIFYPLFRPTMEELSREIIQKQTTNVQTSAESMHTSRILLDAVNYALGQAANGET